MLFDRCYTITPISAKAFLNDIVNKSPVIKVGPFNTDTFFAKKSRVLIVSTKTFT